MILLQVRGVRKFYGQHAVLDGVDFDVRPGQKIALVGPNGAGKTTLLKIAAGVMEPEAGEATLRSGVRLGYLEQQPKFSANETVWDVAADALSDVEALTKQSEELANAIAAATDDEQRHELGEAFERVQHELTHRGGYHLEGRIEQILSGLNFPADVFRQPAATLSGGQQNRLLLAQLLLSAPEIMLLDEPSNHLDLETTQWLEDYLAAANVALLLVSHDRYFLDKIATDVMELFDATIETYRGNFSAYWRQKAERVEVQRRTYEKQQEEIAKTEDFIRRNHYGQKSAQAEDRRKKLERIERVPPPREIIAPPMAFPAAERCGDVALRVEHLAKSFDAPLFSKLSFDVLRGERWGVLGPNGCGKSTLLKCLLGAVDPDDGRVIFGVGVQTGYFDQHLDEITDDDAPVDAIRPAGRETTERERRDLLARFGIRGDAAHQRIGSLSGGERNRVALAKIAAEEANFFILDEPTNHLDLWSRDALERALLAFDGTVLFVSHDRYFLNRVADHLIVMEGDRFRVIPGNYDLYRHMLANGEGAAKAASKETKAAKKNKKSVGEASTRRKRKFPYRKPDDVEADIFAAEEELEAIHAKLADEEVLRDGEQVKQFTNRMKELEESLPRLYEHWEEACEMNT